MTTTLVVSREQAEEAVRLFRRSDYTLAFDTETTGLNVRHPSQDRGRTVQFSWRPWRDAVVFELTEVWRPTIALFFEEALELLGHNLKFDAHVMETFGIPVMEMFPPEALHDTTWVARLHDERDGLRLKPLAVKYLGADSADPQTALKRTMARHGWDWATVPVEVMVEYGGNDALITGRLFDLLHPRIAYAYDAYQREQRLSPVLFAMERAGLLVDMERLEEVILEEREALARAEEAIETIAPGLNPSSPIQLLGEFRKRGTPIEDTTAATLKALVAERNDDLAAALIVYRKHAKTLSTYAEPWASFVAADGRIRPSLNQMGAATGRFSSDLPNFQNITRGHGLRDLIVPAPGHRLVVADWNQMELRLYAHFANDEVMRAAFLSGDDIYQQAADLLGVSRDVGKMVMLASIYGAGPDKLRGQCLAMAYKYGKEPLVPTLSSYDWRDLHARFHRAYSIRDLARLTELAARRRGMVGEPYIRTLGGRRQRPKTVKLPAVEAGGPRQTAAIYKDLANSLVQGSSADLMKQALIDTAAAGLLPYMRLTVHDEQVLEVPAAEVPEAEAVLQRVMTRREFIPPLTIGITAVDRYGDAK